MKIQSTLVITDQLTVSLGIALLPQLLFRKVRKIIFWNKSNIAQKFFRALQKMQFISTSIEPMGVSLWELTDSHGGNRFPEIVEMTRRICSNLIPLSLNEFHIFSKDISSKDMGVFFYKLMWENIYPKVIWGYAVKAFIKNKQISENILYCVRRESVTVNGGILARAFQSLDIPLTLYRDYNFVTPYLEFIHWIMKSTFVFLPGKIFKTCIKYFQKSRPSGKGNMPQIDSSIKVMGYYMGKTISFQDTERSDFFWLRHAEELIPQTKLVFWRSDFEVKNRDAQFLRLRGFHPLQVGPNNYANNFPHWGIFRIEKAVFIRLGGKLLRYCLVNPFSLVRDYFKEMFRFVYGYSLWSRIFRENNIRLGYFPNDFDKYNVAIFSALKRIGGIGLSNQFSNIWFSSGIFSSNADVLFSFSPHYESFWKSNGSFLNRVVFTGYITDHSFEVVLDRSKSHRNQLEKMGAKTIIAFFDENSSNDPFSLIPNQRTSEMYAQLFEWVLSDPKIGFIFKPGYPRTLFDRISSVGPLSKKANETGRCLFLMEGNYVTDQLPVEAAQAADVAVGLHLAGTTVLESVLAGVPSLFLDLEKIYSSELYSWGRSKVIFDSVSDLRSFVTKRQAHGLKFEIHPQLLNWARQRDIFRDGKASYRIGQYIKGLYQSLNKGRNRQDALEEVSEIYRSTWGAQSVSVWT